MWSFNKYGFLDYMRDEFPTILNNHFTWDFFENVIDYLLSETKDKDCFVEKMEHIIPEINKQEVERYITEFERYIIE